MPNWPATSFDPTPFKWLGGLNIALLIAAVLLSVYILTGRHSKKKVLAFCGTVLALLITVTVSCMIIYAEYH